MLQTDPQRCSDWPVHLVNLDKELFKLMDCLSIASKDKELIKFGGPHHSNCLVLCIQTPVGIHLLFSDLFFFYIIWFCVLNFSISLWQILPKHLWACYEPFYQLCSWEYQIWLVTNLSINIKITGFHPQIMTYGCHAFGAIIPFILLFLWMWFPKNSFSVIKFLKWNSQLYHFMWSKNLGSSYPSPLG